MNIMNSEETEELSLSDLLNNLNPLERNSKKKFQDIYCDVNETDYSKILQTLQLQCEQENEKINKLNSLMEYFQQQKPEIEEDEKKILLLIAEERLLDQEIEEQKRKRQTVETRNRVLNEISVKDHIYETVEQYKKSLPQLNLEIQDVKEQITREKETLNEFDIINKTLSEKLELSNEHISYDSRFENSHEKLQKVQEIFDELNRELFKFVEHNFENKKMVDDDNEQRTSSLKTILEDLMNRAFSDSPYIRIDIDRVWKPYVGTLIRAGIAQRHPNDANLIKLVEFHK
ncbi:hypothetical protein Glove_242g76 [Diversispora epigaea]|uniref:Centromere protein Cenp-K n=1 Tax=Diversispora epigaea TaxID=1348612 RepID=A0A397I9T8_9GLOM|nr:hypothetical protein Glove_242g76 [Diversispora epigaea]